MAQPPAEVRSKHTRKNYDALLEAYREQPGRHNNAAHHAGCTRSMARNAWEKGWPGISWAKPIRDVLYAEGDEAALEARRVREARQKESEARRASEDAERAARRRDRLRELAEELQLQGSMRKGVQQVAAVVLALSPAARELVRAVMRACYDEAAGPDGKPLYTPKTGAMLDASVSPAQAMKMLRDWGGLMGKVALAGELVVHLGRETRPPDEADPMGEMSPEDAREELGHLLSIYQGIEAREREIAEGPPPEAKVH